MNDDIAVVEELDPSCTGGDRSIGVIKKVKKVRRRGKGKKNLRRKVVTAVMRRVPDKVFRNSRDGTWPTYVEARAMVQARGIVNRKHYWLWHKKHRVHFLPNRPETAFGDDWVGWNDFLGNSNSFAKRDDNEYLPFWQAARLVHGLGIRSVSGWREYIKENRLPAGVCSNPVYVYRDMWNRGVAWTEWLGLDVVARVDSVREGELLQLWVMVSRGDNRFEVLKEYVSDVVRDGGVKYRVLGKWKYEGDLEGQMWEYLYGVSDECDGRVRVCRNVYDVVGGLNSFLLMVR